MHINLFNNKGGIVMNMINFLKEIENFKNNLSPQAQDFFEELKEKNSGDSLLTETGRKILITMNNNISEQSFLYFKR